MRDLRTTTPDPGPANVVALAGRPVAYGVVVPPLVITGRVIVATAARRS